MKKTCFIIISIFSIYITSCSFTFRDHREKDRLLYFIAPSALPDTEFYMKTPGFWIQRHPYPDSLIMASEQINSLNFATRDSLNLINNLFLEDNDLTAGELRTRIITLESYLKFRKLYKSNGRIADAEFYTNIANNSYLENIENRVSREYGFVVKFTNQRLIPTDIVLTARKFDFDFDRNQNSALDIGTPINIWHISRDGEWVFIDSPLSSGWVRRDHIVTVEKDSWIEYLERVDYYEHTDSDKIIVTTAPKTEIFLDENMTELYGYVRMGRVFPKTAVINNNTVKGVMPFKRQDNNFDLQNIFFKTREINTGYLQYTPRNILEQSFKMLNEPYGWGGMYGEQDCSRFIQMVFAVTGIQMPRNGAAQGMIGVCLGAVGDLENEEKKDHILSVAVGGITTLRFPGHIMLYLGEFNSNPYVIHTVWGYREPGGRKEDIIRVIGRTAVTDLNLGQQSLRGSLLDRLTTIRVVKKGD